MNILNDTNLRFHGVGHNILKFISILEHGILTEDDSKRTKLYTKNYGAYNKSNMVSITISPFTYGTFNHGAFGTFIANGIGFVLENSQGINASKTVCDSGFIDEEFHIGSIDKSNIVGIIVSKDLKNKNISDLNILSKIGTGYVDDTCISILEFLNNSGVMEIDLQHINELISKKNELRGNLDFFEYMEKEKSIILQMNKKIMEYLEQYFKIILDRENVSVNDIIDFYNKDNLPIYDENGRLLNNPDKQILTSVIGKRTIGADMGDKSKVREALKQMIEMGFLKG